MSSVSDSLSISDSSPLSLWCDTNSEEWESEDGPSTRGKGGGGEEGGGGGGEEGGGEEGGGGGVDIGGGGSGAGCTEGLASLKPPGVRQGGTEAPLDW